MHILYIRHVYECIYILYIIHTCRIHTHAIGYAVLFHDCHSYMYMLITSTCYSYDDVMKLVTDS